MNGALLMNGRRITLTLGAAGGGLLAAAFLQTAVAFADTTDFVSPVGPSPGPIEEVFSFEPTGSETVTSSTDDLPFYETSTGTQDFDVIETSITGNPTVGTFDADVTHTDILGVTDSEYGVTSDLTGTTGDPTVGSVYDTLSFDNSGYSIVLTDIPSTTAGGAPDITGAVDTPHGDYTLPPVVDTFLLDIVGAASGDGLTATGGVTADTAGTAAIDGLTGLLGLF
jgi:hypothetical protein